MLIKPVEAPNKQNTGVGIIRPANLKNQTFHQFLCDSADVDRTLGSRMGPRRVIEGQAAELRRRERWEAERKRRNNRRRNVGLLAEN